jgi:hypothetical protein
MHEGNVHGLLYGHNTEQLPSASKCCPTVTMVRVRVDPIMYFKILPANHVHKSLSHNARRLESSHPACQLKPPSDDSSGARLLA